MAKLTDAGRRALLGIRDHDWIGFYFHGQSEFGGLASKTAPYLIRNGWMTVNREITSEGMQLLADIEIEQSRR